MNLQIIQTPDYILGVEIKENYKITPDTVYFDEYHKVVKTAKSSGYGTWHLIIGHTPLNGNKPLEGVPLLPEIEDKIKLNLYTEEDMRKAIVMAVTSKTDFIPDMCNEIIQSLKPFPTEFEVEMEIVDNPNWITGGKKKIIPKVVNNIIQGKFIYTNEN